MQPDLDLILKSSAASDSGACIHMKLQGMESEYVNRSGCK